MDFFRKALIGLWLVVSFGSSAALAQDCISKEEINEIAAKFSQFNNLKGKEFCYDGSGTSNLLKAIQFMRKTAFSSTMPVSEDELFSGKFASDWWTYFVGRINKFSIQSNCPKGAGAFVQPIFGGKTMFVCPLMLSESFSSLDRASVFMHEARHIDGFPHITCSTGPRKGLQGACDDQISDGGSYAVTVETYAQLGKYAADLHPALKAYSQASAVIYAQEAFEVPVKIDQQNQFLVMTKDQRFHQIEPLNGNKITALGTAPHLGKILLRAEHMVLFPEDKTLSAGFVFANDEGAIEQAPGADVVDYNSQTPEQKANLVAIHYGAQWGAKAYQDRVRMACDPTSATVSEISTNGARPLTFLYPHGYSRETAFTYLQLDSGAVLEVGCKNKAAYSTPANLKLDQIYKRIYKSGSVVLALGNDGRLYNLKNGVATVVSTALDGQIHELVPHNTFDFYQN